MNYQKFTCEIGGREMKVELGKLAAQADGAALVTYGQTTVLVTAVMGNEPKDINYLPLVVDYEEKLYAAGKIKGSRFIKREGRPSEEAILTARMIDRAIRPRFNQNIRNEIQIIVTVLSFDNENDPDVPALFGASLALDLAGIPWGGPVVGLRVGRSLENQENGERWLLNPTYKAKEESDFDLMVAGDGEKINMLEGEGKQAPEDVFLSSIGFLEAHIKDLVKFQNKIVEAVSPEKREIEIKELPEDLRNKASKWLSDKLEEAIYNPTKKEHTEKVNLLEANLIKELGDETEETENYLKNIFEEEVDKIVHKNVLEKDKRPDGRKLDEVRPIKSEVSCLARTHGSAIFERGETQALSVLTLGSPGDVMWIDEMEEESKQHFMHHYNFPPFCVGEAKRLFSPGRREIGHGALAEKAVFPLIPDKEEFTYTIRLVSEILSSNGSSSMASVCGSSLALMDGGVPIASHVAGIAMGLIIGSSDYKILTDIQGPEDHHGDMDCKVAGTRKGVTAIQMDVKIEGVTLEILKNVFEKAKKARVEIIEEMEKTIKEPRAELSSLAPRVLRIKIDTNKIGDVIGPGGKIINQIIAETGANIDIDDDGTVSISSTEEEGANKALDWVKSLTREVKPGEVFKGKVTKITDFGAFVEILPNQEGLVHISELASHHVKKVEDEVKTGQTVNVKVKNIDELGRISLTMKDVNNKNRE